MTKTEIKKAKKQNKLEAVNTIRHATVITAEVVKTVLKVTDRNFVIKSLATAIAAGAFVTETGQAALMATDPSLKNELADALNALDDKSAGNTRLRLIGNLLAARQVETKPVARRESLDEVVSDLIRSGNYTRLAQLMCVRLVDEDVRAMLIAFGNENAEGGKALAAEIRKLISANSAQPGKSRFLNALANAISGTRHRLEIQPRANPIEPKPPHNQDTDKKRRAELLEAYNRGDMPPEFIKIDGNKITICLDGQTETFEAR